jgi:hypothetical protein
MIRNLSRSLVAAAVLSVLAAGCGKSNKSLSPSDTVGTNSTQTPAAGLDALTGWGRSDVLAGLPFGMSWPFGLPLSIPTGCGYDAGSQSFVCGPNTLPNGLVETHSYQFLDASGASQTAFDSLTTASIHFASHLSGTTTGFHWSKVDDQHDLVVSGLAGVETSRTWNGTGTSARQDSLGHALIETHVSTSITSVALAVSRASNPYPLSGTISTHTLVSGGLMPIDQTTSLTFNGTRYATLTINGVTYTIDLGRLPRIPVSGESQVSYK